MKNSRTKRALLLAIAKCHLRIVNHAEAICFYEHSKSISYAELQLAQDDLRDLEFQRFLHTPCWKYSVNG